MPYWPQLTVSSESSRGTYCSVSDIFPTALFSRHHDRWSQRRICGCYVASPAVCKAKAEGTHRFIIIKSYYCSPYLILESLQPEYCSRNYSMTFNCFDLCHTLPIASRSSKNPLEALDSHEHLMSRTTILSEAYFVVTFNEIFRISFNYLELNLLSTESFLFNST